MGTEILYNVNTSGVYHAGLERRRTMRIIISPAKKMRVNSDDFAAEQLPRFLDRTEELEDYIRHLDYDGCRALWQCNDAIAALNYERFQTMDLRGAQTPALYAYDGIQYQYMAPNVFTNEELSYVKEHLRILSGFYGLLQPFDAVAPYRLEMQAKPVGFRCGTLYDFWGDTLALALAEECGCIVNLASKEYSKAVRPHLPKTVRWVDCTFAESVGGKLKEKGTQAKMARGAMVRYMAETGVERVEDMLGFDRFGFRYNEAASSENHLIFIKGVV